MTPLLKKLESKGYIDKKKDPQDERNLVIALTEKGSELQHKALCVPETIAREFHITQEEAISLYTILYKILDEERMKDNERL